jgi:uncharacterized protein YacL
MTLGSAMLMALIVLAVDYFTPKKRVSTLFSVFVGLLGALLATVAVGFVIDVIVKSYDIKAADTLVATIKVLLGISLSYLGVTTVLQTQDDFRLVIPYVEFSKQMRGVRPLVLDTSILVDGRIADIAQTNFLLAPIVIPRFVIDELQTLADSSDGVKRSKGRRGLDIVTRLQRAPRLDVSIEDSNVPGKAVDQMLVEFASPRQGREDSRDITAEHQRSRQRAEARAGSGRATDDQADAAGRTERSSCRLSA